MDSSQIDRTCMVAKHAGLPFVVLDEKAEGTPAAVTISVMHLARGLAFRVVAVMAGDDEVIGLQERIEEVSDSSDLEDVYNTERHLLYAACTRARDQLFVSGIEPTSDFMHDIQP